MYIKANFPATFALVAIIFVSCMPLRPNCKRNFAIYKNPVTENNRPLTIKTNGIYISETGNAAFFFYKNGKIKCHLGGVQSYPQEHMKSHETVLKRIATDKEFHSKEYWGDYEIKHNEVIWHTFTLDNERICKRYIYEEMAKIVNDSTIEIYACYALKGKDTVLRGGICRMKFYPTTVKPDSTKAWFNNRKWYANNLHKTRRTQ